MGHPHLHLLLWHQPCCEALDSDPFRLGLRAFSAAQGDCISIRHSYMEEPKKIENFSLTENQKIFHKLLVPTSKKTKNFLAHSVMFQMDFHEGKKNKWKTTVSRDSSHCMDTRDTFSRCKPSTGLWTKVNMEWDYFKFRKRKGGLGQILIGYSI